MSTDSGQRPRSAAASSHELVVHVLLALSLVVIVIPVPPSLLDLLLAAHLMAAVGLCGAAGFVARPNGFSAFSSALTLSLMTRVVTHLALMRLILTRAGSHESAAAGSIIQIVFRVVAHHPLAVTLIVFLTLLTLHLLLVTRSVACLNAAAAVSDHGQSSRNVLLVETPNAGCCNVLRASARLLMGDAVIHGLLTIGTLSGGIALGVLRHQMSVSRAVEVVTLLTVSTSLVMLALSAAGVLAVTLAVVRARPWQIPARGLCRQILNEPAVMTFLAAIAITLTMTGLPLRPLLVVGAGCLAVGDLQRRRELALSRPGRRLADSTALRSAPVQMMPTLELEVGQRRVSHASHLSTETLREEICQACSQMAQGLGIPTPQILVCEKVGLKPDSCQIKFRGLVMARVELSPCSEAGCDIGTGRRTSVQALVDAVTGIVQAHACEFLTLKHVHQMLDDLRQRCPQPVDALVPASLKPAQVHQVLSQLLRESVSIRDLESILQALCVGVTRSKDPVVLGEIVRQTLASTICQSYRNTSGLIAAVTIDPELGHLLSASWTSTSGVTPPTLMAEVAAALRFELSRYVRRLTRDGLPAVIVSPAGARLAVRDLCDSLPRPAVISVEEITPDTLVQSVGHVSLTTVLNAVRPLRLSPSKHILNVTLTAVSAS